MNMDLRIPPSPVERRARLLLRAYPAEYRAERGGEILDTLLEATPDGRGWPALRDSVSLVTGGLRARADLNRRVPLGIALRQATIIGVSLFCAHRAGDSLLDLARMPQQHFSLLPPVVDAVLLILVAVLAWTGSRLAVLAGALGTLAAGMWWDHSDFAVLATLSHGSMHAPGIGALLRNAVPLAIPLAILIGVTGRSARPRIGWLAFPGISLALTVVALQMGNVHQIHAYTLGTALISGRSTAVFLLAGILAAAWLVADTRPALGVAAFLTVLTLPDYVSNAAVFPQDFYSVNSGSRSLETIGTGLVLMAALTLLLRYRARRGTRTVS
jgi:hypothetical protein